ncbi:hypothetical protein HOP50_02g18330 [Chloropicon primus]|uniref:Uncharacterized protein n=1 Tax=Chloropicon primus TaxID=1764295 RepID=A0A5B8MFA4_9CHLO|nr:hypothetical protein A3770_02p18360 [Chloropicon primus]UPQ98527.1 hypothetical protein HOP50_02g18330 [Chloropicon primus]|eukprot:QDZ19318.1 hypothetical protein A3770_02p18360 [Chloropicon primus]
MGSTMRSDFYTTLDQESSLAKPLVSSRSMAKVYFTHNVGTSRLSQLMRLPRFQTSRVKHPEEGGGFLYPTRTRALKAELQRASDYFATILAFLGFRPGDRKRFGLLFTLVSMLFLGFLFPIFDMICSDDVVSDQKLKGLIHMTGIYRFLVYIVSLLWMLRVSRRWNLDALLFLKVDKLYVSRIAEEKGLGGMWVYAAIIQNFALEVMCLFGPYFLIIVFAKAWWFFNSLGNSKLYSSSYNFMGHVLMDSSSPLYVKILFYFADLLSQSYMQIIYLVPCVYFRMVSSLVLLEMKAYKEMVTPDKKADEKNDQLGELLSEDVSMQHSLASNGSAATVERGNSFSASKGLNASSWCNSSMDAKKGDDEESAKDPNLEDSMDKFELEDLPSPSHRDAEAGIQRGPPGGLNLPNKVYMSKNAMGAMRRRRSSVYDRYGSNPFGLYVDSSKRIPEDDMYEFTDSEEEDEMKHHHDDEQSFPVLREHSLLQKVLRLISHRFRQFLLATFILIFFESFGTLYYILNAIMDMDRKEADHYNFTGVVVRLELSSSALLHMMGLIFNVRAILIMTHRLRAVHTIASEQHAHLTCKMDLMKDEDDEKEMLKGLGLEFEQYMKRQSLLQYMVNHPLGITIYGFLIDREFLRSFHMVIVSLTVFLVSMIMGGSHSSQSGGNHKA